jgi:hypothetical protein
MKNTSRSSSKTKSTDVTSDRYMIERGFRPLTPEESKKFAHFWKCPAPEGAIKALANGHRPRPVRKPAGAKKRSK